MQRCVDKVGKEFLANVGTVSVVKDLDLLRAALGDPKLTYLGYSYGTRIGSTYAEMFPQNVRAMVLDGAIDPNADPMEADIRQAEAFQKAFDDYAADCAKSPDCPLGTDPEKAVDVYHSLVDPLVEKPAQTTTLGIVLSRRDRRHHPAAVLADAVAASDSSAARAQGRPRRQDARPGRPVHGTRRRRSLHQRHRRAAAVNCVDRPPITDRNKVVEQDRRIREVAPFMNYGEFTGHAPLSTCAFWPVPPTSQPHTITVRDLPPVLVISTTGDPATPYQAGVDLASQLHGALLTYEGTQHTVALEGKACVDDIVTRYLIDLTVPPPDVEMRVGNVSLPRWAPWGGNDGWRATMIAMLRRTRVGLAPLIFLATFVVVLPTAWGPPTR